MSEVSPLVTTLVVGLGLAFVFGILANRLQISPLVGYLVAGVAVGPFTPGFVADAELAQQLAEIGVILLMFGVGLHFSLKDLLALGGVIVPGALAQILAATAIGSAVAWVLGWSGASAVAFGFALSISSTVVLMRALQGRSLLDTARGHLATGWLIVQDIATILALVLLPPLATAFAGQANDVDRGALAGALGWTMVNLVIFIGMMVVVGRKVIPYVLHYTAHTGSRELFRLAVLCSALVVAFAASQIFGVSLALGAFFAGLFLTESELSQRAAEESLPFRDAFAVLFFVSIGMLFDPTVMLREPLPLLATFLVILLGNGLVAAFLVRAFGYSIGTALTVGAGLSQIGEFSFVLADRSIDLGLLDERARDLILGASILSIFLNPALFAITEAVRRKTFVPESAPSEPVAEVIEPSTLENHAVLVGYGRVGQLLGENLLRDGWPLLVVEDATDLVEKLRSQSIPVIAGNAADDRVLAAANLAEARVLLVAIPNGFEAGQIVQQGRIANPGLNIIARAHFDAEVDHLKEHGADSVIMGEHEISRAMLECTRATATPPRPDASPQPAA
jgi:CPA2 family monovalent cation:H+ antiporter-2